jgi:hypothetical protein
VGARLESQAAQGYKGRKDSKHGQGRSEDMTMANPAPVVGKWYARPGGDSFEVVAFDPDDGTIEIQYFDGTIEEMDIEDWGEESIERAEPPEDWTGSVDVEPEDYENEFDTEPGNGLGGRPLDVLDRGEVDGFSELELPDEPPDEQKLPR